MLWHLCSLFRFRNLVLTLRQQRASPMSNYLYDRLLNLKLCRNKLLRSSAILDRLDPPRPPPGPLRLHLLLQVCIPSFILCGKMMRKNLGSMKLHFMSIKVRKERLKVNMERWCLYRSTETTVEVEVRVPS